MSAPAPAIPHPAAVAIGARPEAAGHASRPLGATLLRVALVAVLGPPVALLGGTAALLAIAMAGSILAVGALVFAFALVAVVAAGLAG